MSIWKREATLDKIFDRNQGSMVTTLGIEFTEIGDDYLVAKMPVDERTRQPLGIMHGGASCVLAETVGSVGAYLCVEEGYYCVGLDINTNHIRAVRDDYVYGTARPFHLGGSTQVWGINITDKDGKLISVTRLTMAVLKRK
jgi:1,4-dihydroxy-2-naphthoyl-CoA hydrolase